MNIKNFEIQTLKKASLCRHFENEVLKRIQNGLITFPVYLSAGQEYVSASIAQLMQTNKPRPMLFGQHRGHSIYLSFGGNISKLIDELLGKKSGCSYGMGGSLGVHSKAIKMFGDEQKLNKEIENLAQVKGSKSCSEYEEKVNERLALQNRSRFFVYEKELLNEEIREQRGCMKQMSMTWEMGNMK